MFSINGRQLSSSHPPYIIAEVSANHGGSIERAIKLIDAANQAGAHAVKLQTYTADTMTIDCSRPEYFISRGPWKGNTLYSLYKQAETPLEWHAELFAHARGLGITIFSSAFDETAVEFLEQLNAPAYKVASFELTDLPLIKAIAQTGKPMLMSTGMASKAEIFEAVEHAKRSGCKEILLFHCISSYPASLKDTNLRMIETLREDFGVETGLSDHTLSNTAACVAVAMGAVAIEKHFVLDRADPGPDSFFSITGDELSVLVQETQSVWESLSSSAYSRPTSEDTNRLFRRSICFTGDFPKGTLLSEANVSIVRPGFGLEPKYIDQVISSVLLSDVSKGEAVSWSHIRQDG
jgi:pseudaminic acid synthase